MPVRFLKLIPLSAAFIFITAYAIAETVSVPTPTQHGAASPDLDFSWEEVPEHTQIHEVTRDVKPTLSVMPVTKLHMGSVTAVFEKTDLDELPGPIYANGLDAAGGETLLCYTVIDKAQSQRIWIWSNNEMNGGAIGHVNAEYVSSDQTLPKACPELSKSLQPVSLDNGIWLGMSKNEVIRRLGAPSARGETVLDYEYLMPITPPDPNSPGTVQSWLMLEFQNNKIARLAAGKLTSY